ncbi:MAG: hypothetical protein ACRD07_20030 [Acidimicrobiales bacterium]
MGMPGNALVGRWREHRARALLVLGVSVVVAIVAVGLATAGVDRVEVVATLLFVPVFAAGLVVGRSAGWLAAAVATIVYVALRSADVDDAGVSSVGLLAVTRAAAYAVAAEVGLRAQPLVDRLSLGNEWDDSPLVARGRAFSKRERPGYDAFAAGQPTSVWVTTPADDREHAGPSDPGSPAWSEPAQAPTGVGAGGSEWAEPLGSLSSEPRWPPDPPARPAASDGWPPDPPTLSPPTWSDPFGSPAIGGVDPNGWAPPAPSPARWSDPGGTRAVSDPADARGPRGPWHDAAPPVRPAPPPRHARSAAPSAPSAPGPPIDPETRLWTARFLCDRIAAEKAYCERSGRPFSLVLVQVPDEPFALLPYRRQVTLLRELGHQFVAGGVIDHLVHVPDQTQHWFAVVLPDIDRAGAQVLERRLHIGIGGYLRSRGLPLPELESASLTSPDDDPALGAIWDALAGSGDPAGAGSSPGVLAY